MGLRLFWPDMDIFDSHDWPKAGEPKPAFRKQGLTGLGFKVSADDRAGFRFMAGITPVGWIRAFGGMLSEFLGLNAGYLCKAIGVCRSLLFAFP